MPTKLIAYNPFPKDPHEGNLLPVFLHYFRAMLPVLQTDSTKTKVVSNTGISHKLENDRFEIWQSTFIRTDREVIWEERMEVYPDDPLHEPQMPEFIKMTVRRRGYEDIEQFHRLADLQTCIRDTFSALMSE